MLNEGYTAAPFRRAGGTIGAELQLCQRYYSTLTSTGNSTLPGVTGYATSGSVMNWQFLLPVPMRGLNSITNSGSTFYANPGVISILADGATISNISIAGQIAYGQTTGASGLSAGSSYLNIVSNNILKFDAEFL
jgi:hypothetical protein